MSDPNYRRIDPPPASEKPFSEYSYIERRAKIFDLIEEAGHYRNIEQSQRQLADRFDVSQTSIWKDIQAITEWMADNLGDNAESELVSLKNAAVQDLISRGEYAEAYQLMADHYALLQDMGVKDREPDEMEIDWREYVQESDNE